MEMKLEYVISLRVLYSACIIFLMYSVMIIHVIIGRLFLFK